MCQMDRMTIPLNALQHFGDWRQRCSSRRLSDGKFQQMEWG